MKKLIFISFLFLTSSSLLKSQDEVKRGFYIGGYYTFLIEDMILESTGDSIQYTQHFMNVNLRYALNHKWRLGLEYILSVTPRKEINDPFYVAGLTVDYDILRTKKSKLHLRGGLSLSNLLYAGDFEPKRRTVVNRVLGISYEFKITRAIWICGGLYGHRPLNKIPYKYALAQPFIGACVGI